MRPFTYALNFLFLIGLVSWGGTSWQGAQAQTLKKEVRGVWITNVDSDVLFSREAIAEAMGYLADNGFNVVFPVVWNKGYTLFPSDVMADIFGENFRQDPLFATQGRDPLAELIVEAHRHGMEVIPWFEYGFAAAFSAGGGHLIQGRPFWAALDVNRTLVKKNGFEWMNAMDPVVQNFMLSLFQEVIDKYDVDGVQGDDRLPALPVEAGYSDVSRSLYRADHNGNEPPSDPRNEAFKRWKASKITAFAGRLYRMVKASDPNLTVSLSPSHYSFSLDEYLQDVPAWLDSNYVDLVHPQLYRYDIGSYRQVSDQARAYVKSFQRGKLHPGILIKAGQRFNDWAYVKEAITYNRRFGVNGEVFFFYEGLREQNGFVGDSLGATFYQEPAIMPNRSGIWRPGGTLAHENDGSTVRNGAWTNLITTPGVRDGVLRASSTSSVSITYNMTAPFSGTFDLHAFIPDVPDATTGAGYTVRVGSGAAESFSVNQDLPQGGWATLTQVTADAGTPITVTLTPSLATDGRSTYADALMLLLNRRLTPELEILTNVDRPDGLPQPRTFAITSTYPNPFAETTTIAFTLDHPARVRLQVYDLLGREVATPLADVWMPAGAHKVPISLAGQASGLYVYRLQTPTASVSRTLTLVR